MLCLSFRSFLHAGILAILFFVSGAEALAQGSCISARVAEAQRQLRARERKVMVTGRVTGFDGAPARKAHAHFERRAWGPAMRYYYIVDVAPDGSYRMKLPEGLYDVSFTGVDHQQTVKYPVFLAEGRDNRIDGRLPLSPFYSVAELDTVMIMYFDLLTMRDVEARMRRVAPGVYEYEAPVDPLQGEVRYHLWGIMPGRRVNGTQSDFFRYDNGGDYQSVLRLAPGDTVLRVRFDHALLPAAGPDQPRAMRDSVWGPPLRHPLAEVVRRVWMVRQEMKDLSETGRVGMMWPEGKSLQEYGDGKRAVLRPADAVGRTAPLDVGNRDSLLMIQVVFNVSGDTLSVDTLILRRSDDQTRLIEREIAAMEKCRRDTAGVEAGACYLPLLEALRSPIWLKKAHTELMREAFAVIPPSSRLWTLSETFTLASELPGVDSLGYLLRMTREQESEMVAVQAYRKLFTVLRQRIEAADSGRAAKGPWRELRDSLYAAVKDCFAGTEHLSGFVLLVEDFKAYYRYLVEEAKGMADVAEERMAWLPPDTLAGTPMADFRYPLYGGGEVTRESMLGKTYLLSVWTGESMPLMFIGYLDEAGRMYRDRGLLSVHVIRVSDTADVRRQLDLFRYSGFGEGWTVGYELQPAEELEAARGTDRFRPRYYLVDPDGLVRISGDRLSSEFVFPTLRKYFEEQQR